MQGTVGRYAAKAIVLIGVLLLPAFASAFEPFNCNACHRGLSSGTTKHKPVEEGECLRCHDQKSNDHPLAKESMGFVVPRQKLCAHCHGALVKKSFLHGPVGTGDCTACHMHHTSDNKSLLKAPVPELCFGCHTKERYTGIHKHKPVDDGKCLSCHDAHQSEGRGLLKKEGPDFCYLCHNAKLGQGKSVHKPVGTGECIHCHMPHGAPFRKLLKAEYPTELYRPFSPEAFPMCFHCHDPELASAETTEKATKFRNGNRNLHAVHVNKSAKGRSCKVCHSPHATVQDRLIFPKAPGFGTWEIPIRFTATATGGGCSVGCHRTFRYDRVKPVEQ